VGLGMGMCMGMGMGLHITPQLDDCRTFAILPSVWLADRGNNNKEMQ